MKIVLVRHSKVLIKHKRIYANELKDFIDSYNNTPIDLTLEPSTELKNLIYECSFFISSSLPRSINTIKIFKREPNYSDKIFSEEELFYTKRRFFRCSSALWIVVFRIIWFARGGRESSNSKRATEILINLAQENGSIMLVGHGIKNRLIASNLKKLGWRESQKLGSRNLGFGVYEK